MAEQTPQEITQETLQSNQYTPKTIIQAEFDARSLSEFVFKPYDHMVQRRLSPDIHTLDWYIRRLDLALGQIDGTLVGDENLDYIASTVLDALEGRIIQGMLYPTLSEKIDRIDSNHDAILKETLDRVNAVSQESAKRRKEILAESEARALAISQEAQDRAQAILDASSAIDVTLSRVSEKIDSEISRLDQTFTDTTSETQTELRTTAQKLEAVTVDYNTNKATFIEKIEANTDATESNALAISGLVTKTDTSEADILEIKETYASDKLAWAEDISGIKSRVGDAEGSIQEESRVRAEQDLALSERISAISAKTGASVGAIIEEARARAESDLALATRVSTLTTKLEGDIATITQEQNVLVDKTQSLASQVSAMSTEFGESSAQILKEVEIVSDAEKATAEKLEALLLEYGDNKVQLTKDLQALADKDKAILEQFETFGSAFETNEANVTRELKALADKDTAIMTDVELMQSKVALNEAAIISEAETRADRDSAMSTKFDGLFAEVNTDIAGVWTEMTARVEEDKALSERIDVLTAEFEDSNATIKREQEVLSSATSAVARSVETLQTTVDGNTASIQTQQKTVDGLSAEYTVKLDVNGRVSGFGLASDDKSSEFAVRADRFYIAPPDGTGKGVIPFVVQATPTTINGVNVPAGTYIANAVIANGSIDTAKIGKLQITEELIAKGTITGDKIAGKTITGDKVAANTITADQINADNLKVKAANIDGILTVGQTDIKVGGRNLLPSSINNIKDYATGQWKKHTDMPIVLNKKTQQWVTVYFNHPDIINGKEYVLSFSMRKVSGTVSKIGGHSDPHSTGSITIDGVNVGGAWASGVAYPNDTAWHRVSVVITKAVKGSFIYIQVDRGQGYTNTSVVEVSDIKLEKGNVATEWTPAPEDLAYSKDIYYGSTTKIDGRNIQTGTVTADSVKANISISAPTITGGSINIGGKFIVDSSGNVTAKSGTFDGTVKLKTGQVDTLQIANEAVIVPRLQFTAGSETERVAGAEREINRITLDAQGGAVAISFGFERLIAFDFGNPVTVVISIRRNNEVIREFRFGTSGGNVDHRWITIPTYLDKPPSGNNTYTVTMRADGRGESNIGTTITARSFQIMGVKR